MTEKQKERFTELFNEYAVKYAGFDRNRASIRRVCESVREWTNLSGIPSDESIETLIEKQGNGISNVGRSVVYLQRAKSAKRDEAFRGLLSEMFNATKKTGRITRVQYDTWKNRFFAAVDDHQLEVIFNRLVFAIFPEQFCSVSKPERLLRVCNAIQSWTGIRLADKVLTDLGWYDLCELVVPLIRGALPEKDYVSRSAFLAAIGVDVG